MNIKAQNLIRNYKLLPHPEGGYYRETYRSPEIINVDGKQRNTATAIYYLLNDGDKSHFHRLSSDEIWFFHEGEALEILLIDQRENLIINTLGIDSELGCIPQFTIKAGTWFAARIKGGAGYSLASCVVAPGFDFADFEMANKVQLCALFPHLKAEIEEMSM